MNEQISFSVLQSLVHVSIFPLLSLNVSYNFFSPSLLRRTKRYAQNTVPIKDMQTVRSASEDPSHVFNVLDVSNMIRLRLVWSKEPPNKKKSLLLLYGSEDLLVQLEGRDMVVHAPIFSDYLCGPGRWGERRLYKCEWIVWKELNRHGKRKDSSV